MFVVPDYAEVDALRAELESELKQLRQRATEKAKSALADLDSIFPPLGAGLILAPVSKLEKRTAQLQEAKEASEAALAFEDYKNKQIAAKLLQITEGFLQDMGRKKLLYVGTMFDHFVFSEHSMPCEYKLISVKEAWERINRLEFAVREDLDHFERDDQVTLKEKKEATISAHRQLMEKRREEGEALLEKETKDGWQLVGAIFNVYAVFFRDVRSA